MPNTKPESKASKRPPKAVPRKQSTQKKTARRPVSREELSRHQREMRARRVIFSGMGAMALLVVVILVFGLWREYVARASEPVASVAGKTISIDSFARRVDFRRKATEQQAQLMQLQLQSNSGNESIANLYRQQIQQLQFSLLLLPDQTLDQMVDEELVRQEAARRGLSVSPEEIEAEIARTFGDQPTPVPAPSPTVGAAQPTAQPAPSPTAAPTSTPAPTADVKARFTSFLLSYGMSGSEYRSMIEAQLLYQKLQTAMGADVPASTEQVRARHILLDTEEKAKEVLGNLKGGANFEELAKAESKDPGSGEKGGDLGWFPRGAMVAEFDAVAFQLAVNQLSDPVKTQFGWHLIEVLEKDQNRALDEPTLSNRKSAAISEWLSAARTSPEIKRELTEDRKSWVYEKIRWRPPA